MSPRKKLNMRIALPPRVNLAIAQGSESPMSSPTPHTPLPYSFPTSPQIALQSIHDDTDTDEEPVAGQKRGREAEEVEVEWSADEVEQIRSTLIHPFRPISHTYPPGELPPSEALDDLASQILQHAFKSGSTSHRSTPRSDISVVQVESSRDARMGGWRHGWAATRRKLSEVALAESNFGKDDRERRMPRAERKAQRPGLKRMDSMDFLDQDEDSQENIGRALRLSTTLQNTAKADPLLVALSRTPSAGSSTGLSDPMAKLSAHAPPATITLTPPSPQPKATVTESPTSLSPSIIPHPMPTAPAPPMRRRVSSRSSMPRPARPSLLQRGRSFTASDLQAESGTASPSPTKNTPSPIKEHPASMPSTASPGSSAPSTSVKSPPSPSPIEQFQPPSLVRVAAPPRLTRSLSSIAVGASHPPHSHRDAFLAHPPTLSKGPILAQPAQIGVGLGIKSVHTGGGEWSDSEDEGAAPKPKGKKAKAGRKIAGQKRLELALGSSLSHLGGLGGVEGDGLRSPFEEKGFQL